MYIRYRKKYVRAHIPDIGNPAEDKVSRRADGAGDRINKRNGIDSMMAKTSCLLVKKGPVEINYY